MYSVRLTTGTDKQKRRDAHVKTRSMSGRSLSHQRMEHALTDS